MMSVRLRLYKIQVTEISNWGVFLSPSSVCQPCQSSFMDPSPSALPIPNSVHQHQNDLFLKQLFDHDTPQLKTL